jgi:hypothetical protein
MIAGCGFAAVALQACMHSSPLYASFSLNVHCRITAGMQAVGAVRERLIPCLFFCSCRDVKLLAAVICLHAAGLEKVCRRLVPGGGARFLVTKVVLDSAVMGSVYVAAFFAFGSVVLEGNGLQGFLQKMKVCIPYLYVNPQMSQHVSDTCGMLLLVLQCELRMLEIA